MAFPRKNWKKNGKLKPIWEEFVNQLKAKGYEVKKGVIQDATFITSDPGHAKSDVPRGDKANTRRSKDGAWSKKGNKSYFGLQGTTFKSILRIISSGRLRLPLLTSWQPSGFGQMKERSDMETKGIMVQKPTDMMHQWKELQGGVSLAVLMNCETRGSAGSDLR